ncbi:presenilin family intramembrane aspartyl protease PSH [Salinilacihabitans rarus]|uniref:presenilin family intramembrane aspartyl protease PSH n=1 Tax=Salinilacihabitans rarus TaxID=2961596 RepID=UPI0020C85C8F|nr:presenilin family intramembrane aspartyl protease PSH [Salinilacihabitans rarus]
MNDRARIFGAVLATVLLFLGVQLGALALVEPFTESGMQAVEDPQDPTNSLLYFAVVLVMTGFMLAAFRYGARRLVRAVVVVVSVMLAWFVFAEVLPPVVVVGAVGLLPLAAAAAVGVGLFVYPEWYVIDAAGVVMGAGAAGLFGISFGLLPAIVLLSVLAIYDAISVYRTGHMLSLAEGVMDLRIPVVLVIPTTLSYSFLADEGPEALGGDGDGDAADPDREDAAGREAIFVGLGDAVIPTILVASAASFLDAPALGVPGIALNVPALGALCGTIAGLLALMYAVMQGRPHAGLPLLNGGAIGGYLLAAVASGLPVATALGL